MDDFKKQMETILNECRRDLSVDVEKALTESSQVMVQAMQQASPTDDTHDGVHLKDCWAVKTKYPKVRYVGNTKLTQDGIPLTSILEYSVKGRPFIAATFEANKGAVLQQFKQSIGGTK